jgi:hypothetical protein
MNLGACIVDRNTWAWIISIENFDFRVILWLVVFVGDFDWIFLVILDVRYLNLGLEYFKDDVMLCCGRDSRSGFRGFGVWRKLALLRQGGSYGGLVLKYFGKVRCVASQISVTGLSSDSWYSILAFWFLINVGAVGHHWLSFLVYLIIWRRRFS